MINTNIVSSCDRYHSFEVVKPNDKYMHQNDAPWLLVARNLCKECSYALHQYLWEPYYYENKFFAGSVTIIFH